MVRGWKIFTELQLPHLVEMRGEDCEGCCGAPVGQLLDDGQQESLAVYWGCSLTKLINEEEGARSGRSQSMRHLPQKLNISYKKVRFPFVFVFGATDSDLI
jgi:hypothetical protein